MVSCILYRVVSRKHAFVIVIISAHVLSLHAPMLLICQHEVHLLCRNLF